MTSNSCSSFQPIGKSVPRVAASINKVSCSNTCSYNENFYKSLQFSCDGSSILTSTEDNHFQVWNLYSNECINSVIDTKRYYPKNESTASSSCASSKLSTTGISVGDDSILPVNISKEIYSGESIYDCKWYPYANISDLGTYCFASTCRGHPIHLWDAATGVVRCTYRGHNYLDELDVSNCLSFNLTGDKLYSGSKRLIRCFDVANPTSYYDIHTCKSKRSLTGQKGIISSLTFNPDYSGTYAAGSYDRNIGVYVENMDGCVLEINQLELGVTCLKWSSNGCNLWIGGRKSDHILCWDIRNTRKELGRIKRQCASNQRMSFDLDPWGCYLATGSEDGKLLIYNTQTFELVYASHSDDTSSSGCSNINSCSFHPVSSIIGTATGNRTFPCDTHDSDDDDDDAVVSDVNRSDTSIDLYKFTYSRC